jgi:hypothetical protein
LQGDIVILTSLSPFIVFWVLIYLGREELGLKGVIASILIWLGLLVGSSFLGIPYFFASAEALLDIVLLFIIFGGNMNIPLR